MTKMTAANSEKNKLRLDRLRQLFGAIHNLSESSGQEPSRAASLEVFLTELARLHRAIPSRIEPNPAEAPLRSTGLKTFVRAFGPLVHDLRTRGEFINVWEVAGLRKIETRNAAVLSWLFDANQTHGRGSSIFLAFIRRLAKQHEAVFPLPTDISGGYSVSTECYPLGNVENRVDIVID